MNEMAKKFDSKKFKFGDSVIISGKISSGYDRNTEGLRRIFREDYDEKNYIKGKIFCIKRFMVGNIEREYCEEEGHFSSQRSYNVFILNKVVFAWGVVTSLGGKQLYCLPDQIKLLNEDIDIPVGISCKWSDEEKEFLRKIMKDMPRDKRGRWIKKIS